MNNDIIDKLKQYLEILKDDNCLKIIYYLYNFNPDIPIKEIEQELEIPENTIKDCIQRLVENGIIFKNPETNALTLTPSGRNAFKELIDSN